MPTINTKPNVVFVLPTYNEAENISVLIENLQPIFQNLINYSFHILVVDDNSPDGTASIVRKLAEKFSNIHLLTGEKKGLGAAYVRGMHYAVEKMNANILFEMDSDFSHDPKIIPQFLKEIEKGAEYVVGSRYIKGGAIPADWGWQRKLYSLIGNLIVRYGLMLPKIKEWSNGYRAIKAGVFKTIEPGLAKYSGYTFQIASLHRVLKAGYKVKEIPIIFIDRKYGESKFEVFDYAPNVLKYVLLNSSFIRFCVVGGTGFLINLIGLELFYRLGFKPFIATAIGAEFAIISNFILNNYWTFSHKKIAKHENKLRKFIQFNTVSFGALLIQAFIVGIGTNYFGDKYRIVFLVLAVAFFVIPYSYFMYNRFIWKGQKAYA